MSKRRNRYSAVPEETGDKSHADEAFHALQFKEHSKPEIPWKGVLLAVALLGIGLVFLGISLNAYYFGDETNDRKLTFAVIGLLAFIPGIYHVWIAYNAYNGTPGYHFDDIPNFD